MPRERKNFMADSFLICDADSLHTTTFQKAAFQNYRTNRTCIVHDSESDEEDFDIDMLDTRVGEQAHISIEELGASDQTHFKPIGEEDEFDDQEELTRLMSQLSIKPQTQEPLARPKLERCPMITPAYDLKISPPEEQDNITQEELDILDRLINNSVRKFLF